MPYLKGSSKATTPSEPKRKKRVEENAAAAASSAPADELSSGSPVVKIGVGLVVAFMAIAGVYALYTAVFRDLPPHLRIDDNGVAELQKHLASGHPSVFFCNNGTNVNTRARGVFEGAYHELKSEMYFASVDCHSALPSGKSLIERFSLATYDPVWFLAYHGRKPTQLSPALVHRRSELVAQLRASIVSRVKKLGNSVDLKSCIHDRSGGCVVVYTARSADDVKAELEDSVMKSHPLQKLSVLSSSSLALHMQPDTHAQRVLTASVRYAKEQAAAATDGAAPPDVLVLFRPVPAAARGQVAHRFLVSSTTALSAGAVGNADIDALLALSDKAVDYLSKPASPASDGGVDIDALFAREDELEALSSATLDDSDAQITWSASKMPKKQSASLSDDMPLDAEGRRERRAALKKAYGSARGSSSDNEEEDDPAVIAQREKDARQHMAAKEAESAFVAHLAEDEEFDSGDGDEFNDGHHHAGDSEDLDADDNEEI